MNRRLRILLIAISLAALGGCYFRVGRVPGVIYVTIAPPTPRAEVIIAAPGPRHVWRPGHWRWEVREYVWVPGMWIAIEPGFREWVPGRWVRDRHGWYWREGHWR